MVDGVLGYAELLLTGHVVIDGVEVNPCCQLFCHTDGVVGTDFRDHQCVFVGTSEGLQPDAVAKVLQRVQVVYDTPVALHLGAMAQV